jgi:hypothetical protein
VCLPGRSPGLRGLLSLRILTLRHFVTHSTNFVTAYVLKFKTTKQLLIDVVKLNESPSTVYL